MSVPGGYNGCRRNTLSASLSWARRGSSPRELSQRLQKMARFRNVLVHLYWTVDYERLYDIIRGDLGDLREFVRAIGGLL
jgi:uncharacterized protein YutE (UPF0331/DUF86 family)